MSNTLAIVVEEPERLSLSQLALDVPQAGDVVVETLWSGISTGTERLLFTGRMPAFPGMGYPLVPGYETVGKVVEAGPRSAIWSGKGFRSRRALLWSGARTARRRGLAPRRAAARVVPVSTSLGDKGVLLALAATAYHALAGVGRATAT